MGITWREKKENSNFCRRPESPSCDTVINQNGNSQPNSRETEIRTCAQNGHNSEGTDSGSDLIRLSGELIQGITK